VGAIFRNISIQARGKLDEMIKKMMGYNLGSKRKSKSKFLSLEANVGR
jgi:predicted nucleotidyltransferase